MGSHGKELMPDGGSVLTHCNTGALATSAFGTALGVIRAGWEDDQVELFEKRVFLKGLWLAEHHNKRDNGPNAQYFEKGTQYNEEYEQE